MTVVLPASGFPAASGGIPRVVIDLEKIRRINSGLGRFSLHLGRGLLDHLQGRIDPVLLLPAGGEAAFRPREFTVLRARPWRKEFVQRRLRPLAARLPGRRRYDLWHMTNQMSRYEPLDPRVPMILTIHDLTFLHEPARGGRHSRTARKLADIQRRVDRAAAVVTDSRFVADDIRRELRLGDRPLHVIPLGLAPPPPPASERPGFLADDRPFLLTVGNALPHKNVHVLLDLVERLPDHRLVVAGNHATPYGDLLRQEIVERRLEGRVTVPGEVSDEIRQWLYERCEAFLFPSLSEGFGFPVLEALAAGRPVFVTRRTSLPELVGEHGFYFDSFDPDAMAAVLADGLARFGADVGFASRGRAHAATFTWERTVGLYASLYAQLAAG